MGGDLAVLDSSCEVKLTVVYTRKFPMELWGGVECTVNRVHNTYFDQLKRSEHRSRLSDFDLFADLGIKALRHGVLWEKVAPRDLEDADWSWADTSLSRLRDLKIRPLVGLLHHGSGPRHTSLTDVEFPEKLAYYATAVARRYPWIQDYTPVNEPLTTARFSGLYGFWYPHGRNDFVFLQCLLNECKATALAMRSIREVNSKARLIQTEDLGKAFSTPRMAYQAEFENHRRWFSYDLLCGKVDHDHVMWRYALRAGVKPRDLEWFLENPCPPDVMGINHYLSSERFLDEHIDRYPTETHGSNGQDRYADVVAARVRVQGADGISKLLMEAWERYHIPLAVTECHNGCTREEQMRWFLEMWRGAYAAREAGVNVLAVTAWALLGSFDWNSLVTREEGHYEPGVYDVRSPSPRPTALCSLLKSLPTGDMAEHEVLRIPGWWKRADRLIYGAALDEYGRLAHLSRGNSGQSDARPVLITGGNGTLGHAFTRICDARAIPYRAPSRAELDITSRSSVEQAMERFRPWAVINAAGYVRVDDAEQHFAACFRENATGPRLIAEACAARNLQMLTFSSDLVFDGKKQAPYLESDPLSPLSRYGWSKVEAERVVLETAPDSLVVRTSAFFGPWDRHNFLFAAIKTLESGNTFAAAEDTVISPTYIPDLVNACLDLLIDGESGIWHLSNQGELSWAEFAAKAAERMNINASKLRRCKLAELGLSARRPLYSSLGSERGQIMPTLDNALQRYAMEVVDRNVFELAA